MSTVELSVGGVAKELDQDISGSTSAPKLSEIRFGVWPWNKENRLFHRSEQMLENFLFTYFFHVSLIECLRESVRYITVRLRSKITIALANSQLLHRNAYTVKINYLPLWALVYEINFHIPLGIKQETKLLSFIFIRINSIWKIKALFLIIPDFSLCGVTYVHRRTTGLKGNKTNPSVIQREWK